MIRRSPSQCVAGALAVLVLASPAGAVSDQAPAGRTDSVLRQVRALQKPDIRELNVGEDVFVEDVVSTGARSAVEITFKDGTRFSMGAQSEVALENIPAATGADESFVLRAAKGVYKFVSGALESDAYRIETPTATIGVRGTVVPFRVLEDGTTEVSCLSGQVRACGCDECVTLNERQYTRIGPDCVPTEPAQIPDDFYIAVRKTWARLMLNSSQAVTVARQVALADAGTDLDPQTLLDRLAGRQRSGGSGPGSRFAQRGGRTTETLGGTGGGIGGGLAGGDSEDVTGDDGGDTGGVNGDGSTGNESGGTGGDGDDGVDEGDDTGGSDGDDSNGGDESDTGGTGGENDGDGGDTGGDGEDGGDEGDDTDGSDGDDTNGGNESDTGGNGGENDGNDGGTGNDGEDGGDEGDVTDGSDGDDSNGEDDSDTGGNGGENGGSDGEDNGTGGGDGDNAGPEPPPDDTVHDVPVPGSAALIFGGLVAFVVRRARIIVRTAAVIRPLVRRLVG